jgi:Xaa-Pro aminopeptidase/Xaa-Pro dipeptidase
MRKDPIEQAMILEAVRCSDAAFKKLIPLLKAGMTEKDLADELHYLVNREGGESMSFGTIVGSGPRGALAHAKPSSRNIQSGEMAVVDFGVTKSGYVSDMTRTLIFGEVSKEMLDIHSLVICAMKAALETIRPGVAAKDVEQAHRNIFIEAGLEEYALKGLGHGIGLQVHECPRIVIGNETILDKDMIFTIEPGLYFPDRFGARTEDVVMVTADGFKVFTETPHVIHV